jgi:putative ABC transport system permease protein
VSQSQGGDGGQAHVGRAHDSGPADGSGPPPRGLTAHGDVHRRGVDGGGIPGGGPGRARPAGAHAARSAGPAHAVRRIRAGWIQLTGAGPAVSAGLALLMFACVFMAVAGPRASLNLRTYALRRALAGTGSLAESVYGNVDYSGFSTMGQGPFSAASISHARRALASKLAAQHLPLASSTGQWDSASTGIQPVSGAPKAVRGGHPPLLKLIYRVQLARYTELAAGRLPSASRVTADSSRFEIAVTQQTADVFGLRPGSTLRTGTSTTLEVTGILRPHATGSPFWTADPVALGPRLMELSANLPAFWVGAAVVGPGELPGIKRAFPITNIQLSWDFPLDLSQLAASQVPALEHTLTTLTSTAGQIGHAVQGQLAQETQLPEPVPLTASVVQQLADFGKQDRAVSSVLSLQFVSLAMVAALAVLLCCWLLAEHRRGELTVSRARGASAAQQMLMALRSTAAITLPAALLAAVLAVLVTPGATTTLGYWLAALTVLTALAGTPLIVLRWHRGAAVAGGQGKLSRRRAVLRRVLGEAALLAATVGGLALLRRQGVGSHANWFLSLAPVLTAIPAAIVVLRCYPLVLRGLVALAAARRGVAAFVGGARAARAALTVALPVFALVIALTVAAFGAMARSSVRSAQVAASWQQVGADAVIASPSPAAPLSTAAARAIAAVPGVRHIAVVSLLTGSTARGFQLTVAAADPAQLAAVMARNPAGAAAARAVARLSQAGSGTGAAAGDSAAAATPALVTPGAAKIIGGGTTLRAGARTLGITVTGRAPVVPGVRAAAVVLVPASSLRTGPRPGSLVLVTGAGLDSHALTAVAHRYLPGAAVTVRSAVLAGLIRAPVPEAGFLALAGGAGAAALLSVAVLLITLLLGARSRELTMTRLRVIGLAPRQARWLTATEVLPQVAAAAVGGACAALVLAPLLGQALNLSPFAGSSAAVPVRLDPVALAVTTGVLLGLALLALLASEFTARHRNPAAALRDPAVSDGVAAR